MLFLIKTRHLLALVFVVGWSAHAAQASDLISLRLEDLLAQQREQLEVEVERRTIDYKRAKEQAEAANLNRLGEPPRGCRQAASGPRCNSNISALLLA